MAKLTGRQRAYLRKKTRAQSKDPSELDDELNIVPFLDIVVNLVMFLLMSLTAVAMFAQLEVTLPTLGRSGTGSGAEKEKDINLTVTLVSEGVIVAAIGGKLAPGCTGTGVGRVISVPQRGGQYDWQGLTDCVARVKAEHASQERITVTADDPIQYEHVVAAMDAVRNKGSEELFPEVLLSAGLR